MIEKTLAVLFLLGLPTAVLSQAPAVQPQQGIVVSPDGQTAGVDATEAEAKLRELLKSRNTLTKEIRRLQKLTGTFEQVVVSVQVCELSLAKACEVELPPEFDSVAVGEHGFRAILSSRKFNPNKPPVAAAPGKATYEAVVNRTLDNGEALQEIIATLADAGALEVLAKPTVVTVSGQPGSVHIGGEFPIRVFDASGNSAIQFKAYGTQLTVLPEVLGQKRIRLDVRPSVSEIDHRHAVRQGGESVPGLRTRGVSTRVEMTSGQTFVLAGLVQQRAVTDAAARPRTAEPIDTDAPGDTESIELIILIRPEIVASL